MSDDDGTGSLAWLGLAGAKGYFAGAGCILLSFLVCGGLCAWFVGGSYLEITRSAAYVEAMGLVRAKPEVIKAFGGSVEQSGLGGWEWKGWKSDKWFRAELPLKGPAGEGSMTLEASGSYDQWRIDDLKVTKGSESWDLTPPRPR